MIPSIPKKIKNQNQFPTIWNNMEFDSKEEIYFYWWLKELEEIGVITNIKKANTIRLEEPLISCKHELLPAIDYTADYYFEVIKDSDYFQDFNYITISPKARKKKALIYQIEKSTGKKVCIVEVKADFDNRDKTREVNIKRKWIYSRFNIFVELVKVPKIFEQTFLPKRFLQTDMGTLNRKINFTYQLLNDETL